MLFLLRSYNGPYRTSPEHKGSSQRGGPRTNTNFLNEFEEMSRISGINPTTASADHSRRDPQIDYTNAADSEVSQA